MASLSKANSRTHLYIYDWQHFLLVAQRKPGALCYGAPFNSKPDSFKRIQSILARG